MYDLLIKGGTVLDPSQGLHETLDIAVSDGNISHAAPSIPTTEAATTIPADGKIVTPGLIDIHTHVYRTGRTHNHPDSAGVLSGVTTVSDAGGTALSDFHIFSAFVRSQARTKVYGFLNITMSTPLPTGSEEAEKTVSEVAQIARANPDLVKGIKVLVQERSVKAYGLKNLEFSKRAAREAGIRLMMHIGDFVGTENQSSDSEGLTPTPPEMIAEALSMLDPGDILTHVFTPRTGGVVDREGRLLPQLREAQQRGVTIDTAYGNTGFGWDRAEEVLAQGFIPDTIGTDVEIQASTGTRRSGNRWLLEYASFYLAMGFSLEDVIRMITVNPAKALGIADGAGSLALGREADISVLDLVEGQWELTDAVKASRIGSKALVPVVTVKGGRVFEPGEPPHPWGWTPPVAVKTPSGVGDGS